MGKGFDVLAAALLIGGILLIYYSHRLPEKDDKTKTVESNVLIIVGVILGITGLVFTFRQTNNNTI